MTNRKTAFFLLKLIVLGLLLFWIVKKVDMGTTLALISSANPSQILVAFVILVLDRIVMSYRWNILLRAKSIKVYFPTVVKIYFLSTFLGNFLPSSVGPDAVRIFSVSRYASSKSDAWTSIFIDRLMGLFSLAVVALSSVVGIVVFLEMEINRSIWVAILILFCCTFLLFFFDRIPLYQISRVVPFLRKESFCGRLAAKFLESFGEYRNDSKTLASVLLLSFCNHLIGVLVIWVLSLSIGSQAPILYFFAFVPLMSLLIMVPVSVGNLGMQEGVFIYFFSKVGMLPQEALSLAILYRVVVTSVSLPGGIFYLCGSERYESITNP